MTSFPSAMTGPLKPWPRGLVQTVAGAPPDQVAATGSSGAAAPLRVGPRNWGQSPARVVIVQAAMSQSAGRVALRNIERRGGTIRSSRTEGSGSSGRGRGMLHLHAGASFAPPRIVRAIDPGRRRACPGVGGWELPDRPDRVAVCSFLRTSWEAPEVPLQSLQGRRVRRTR